MVTKRRQQKSQSAKKLYDNDRFGITFVDFDTNRRYSRIRMMDHSSHLEYENDRCGTENKNLEYFSRVNLCFTEYENDSRFGFTYSISVYGNEIQSAYEYEKKYRTYRRFGFFHKDST